MMESKYLTGIFFSFLASCRPDDNKYHSVFLINFNNYFRNCTRCRSVDGVVVGRHVMF